LRCVKVHGSGLSLGTASVGAEVELHSTQVFA
jgi:hypothetical protein